jgi:hypothetical protein
MQNLPDLSNSAKLLTISVRLEESVKRNDMISAAIYTGLRNKQLRQVIKMIRSMAEDNEQMIGQIIGDDLLNDIKGVDIE